MTGWDWYWVGDGIFTAGLVWLFIVRPERRRKREATRKAGTADERTATTPEE